LFLAGIRQWESKRGSAAVSENSLLERVTAAAERALLSMWAAAEALVLETLPSGRAREFYET
jgi:hypothetical protein